jgi:hypothetical protein
MIRDDYDSLVNVGYYNEDNTILSVQLPYHIAVERILNKNYDTWNFIERIVELYQDMEEEEFASIYDDEVEYAVEKKDELTFLFLEDVNKKIKPSWHVLSSKGFIPYSKNMLN